MIFTISKHLILPPDTIYTAGQNHLASACSAAPCQDGADCGGVTADVTTVLSTGGGALDFGMSWDYVSYEYSNFMFLLEN